MPNKIFINLIVSCALSLVSHTIYSNTTDTSNTIKNDRLYQVEIIAYEIKNSISSEAFSPYPALPDLSNAIELQVEPNEEQETYILLPRTQQALNREENLISKKERYNILFHYSWLQRQNNEQKIIISSDEPNAPKLKGTIEIHRGYYYFTTLQLDYLDEEQQISKHYVLNSKRKLKNKEMHYIDHPKFGVLLQITTL